MRSAVRRLPVSTVIGVILLGWSVWYASASIQPEAIVYWLRMATLAGGAILSISLPHLLFPYPRFDALLLAPPTRARLMRTLLQRALGVLLIVLTPLVVLGVRAPASADFGYMLAAGLSVLSGVWIVAVAGAVRLGGRSQAWQEGRAGGWYRSASEHASMPPLVPDGAMPMLFLTTGVFLLSIAGVVVTEYVAQTLAAAVLLVPGLMVAVAAAALLRLYPTLDAELFRSQAFFSELFRMHGGLRHDVRPAISYDAVYWSPERYRPAVWALLVQFDRRLPLGRLIGAAHVFIWLIAFSAESGQTLLAPLLVVAMLKNASPGLLGAGASPPIHVTMHRATGWTFVRFFASIRWTLPWVLSLSGLALFTSVFTWTDVLIWAVIDGLLAFALAFVITQMGEGRRLRLHA